MLQTELKFGEVFALDTMIEADTVGPQFKNIFKNDNGGVAVLAFKTGQRLDKHLSPAELMVYVVEGEIVFTMIDRLHTLKKGDFLLVGEGVPHEVFARTDSKVLLVKVKA